MWHFASAFNQHLLINRISQTLKDNLTKSEVPLMLFVVLKLFLVALALQI